MTKLLYFVVTVITVYLIGYCLYQVNPYLSYAYISWIFLSEATGILKNLVLQDELKKMKEAQAIFERKKLHGDKE